MYVSLFYSYCFNMIICRWRIFRWPIIGIPDRIVVYTQAAVALHNYLRSTECSPYCPPGYVDGEDGGGNILHGESRRDEDACAVYHRQAVLGN